MITRVMWQVPSMSSYRNRTHIGSFLALHNEHTSCQCSRFGNFISTMRYLPSRVNELQLVRILLRPFSLDDFHCAFEKDSVCLGSKVKSCQLEFSVRRR